MKNINYVISGVLAVAVIVLFVLQFSDKKNSDSAPSFSVADSSSALLPIAYVNVDSLLLNYNYAKDMTEAILRKQENSRASVMQKARQLETEVQEYQRKVENNAFLTRERAEQEQTRLMKKQQELQELDARLAQEVMAERQKIDEQLHKNIVDLLEVYNKSKGYQIIFTNTMGDNILLANPKYDITTPVTEFLNKNYNPSTSDK